MKTVNEGEASMAGNSTGTAKRGPGRPFQPGESGNPAGRPKVAEEFRARARRATDEMVFTAWEEEVRDRGPSWLRASELLAAYGYGKPSSAPEDLEAVSPGPYAPRELVLAALERLAKDGE